MIMLQALYRTLTETADSKKAFYSFIATVIMAVCLVVLKTSPEIAAMIAGPFMVATGAQAHVDAAEKKAQAPAPAPAVDVGPVVVTPPAPPAAS
jgi:hypothetical protein